MRSISPESHQPLTAITLSDPLIRLSRSHAPVHSNPTGHHRELSQRGPSCRDREHGSEAVADAAAARRGSGTKARRRGVTRAARQLCFSFCTHFGCARVSRLDHLLSVFLTTSRYLPLPPLLHTTRNASTPHPTQNARPSSSAPSPLFASFLGAQPRYVRVRLPRFLLHPARLIIFAKSPALAMHRLI